MKADEQEDQAHKEIAREVHPDLQDGTPWMRKRMTMWEKWCLFNKKKKEKTARERSPKPMKKSVREGKPVPRKELARVRNQVPWKKTSKEGALPLPLLPPLLPVPSTNTKPGRRPENLGSTS